jgi:hypothetical protein
VPPWATSGGGRTPIYPTYFALKTSGVQGGIMLSMMTERQYRELLERRATERSNLITLLCALPDFLLPVVGRFLKHLYITQKEQDMAEAKLAPIVETEPFGRFSEYTGTEEGDATGELFPAACVARCLSDQERKEHLKSIRRWLDDRHFPDRTIKLILGLLSDLPDLEQMFEEILHGPRGEYLDARVEEIEAFQSFLPDILTAVDQTGS